MIPSTWSETETVGPEIPDMQLRPLGLWPRALVSKSLCVSLCVPCALLVDASGAHWDHKSHHSPLQRRPPAALRKVGCRLWRPPLLWIPDGAILVRSLCSFLVQKNFGSLCVHPFKSAQENVLVQYFLVPACAVLVRICFRLVVSIQHSTNFVVLLIQAWMFCCCGGCCCVCCRWYWS